MVVWDWEVFVSFFFCVFSGSSTGFVDGFDMKANMGSIRVCEEFFRFFFY